MSASTRTNEPDAIESNAEMTARRRRIEKLVRRSMPIPEDYVPRVDWNLGDDAREDSSVSARSDDREIRREADERRAGARGGSNVPARERSLDPATIASPRPPLRAVGRERTREASQARREARSDARSMDHSGDRNESIQRPPASARDMRLQSRRAQLCEPRAPRALGNRTICEGGISERSPRGAIRT